MYTQVQNCTTSQTLKHLYTHTHARTHICSPGFSPHRLKVCRREGRQRWRGEAGNQGLETRAASIWLDRESDWFSGLPPHPHPHRRCLSLSPFPPPPAVPMVAAASPPFSAATELERSPSRRAAGSVRGSHSILQVGGRGQNWEGLQPQGWEPGFLVPPSGCGGSGYPRVPRGVGGGAV